MTAAIQTTAAAQAAGFVVPMFAECDFHSTDILIPEGTDLDDEFVAYAMDWNECIRIKGWLWTFEAIEAEAI